MSGICSEQLIRYKLIPELKLRSLNKYFKPKDCDPPRKLLYFIRDSSKPLNPNLLFST